MKVPMGYALNQMITTGGLHEERERLWRISRYSNDQAHATYGFEFMRMCEDCPESLNGIDLLSAEISGRSYPMLFNGNNNYSELSSKKLKLSKSVEGGVAADLMIVIPEPIRLMRRGANRNGLTSALSNHLASTTLPIIDAESVVPNRIDRSELVRAYDSHPSIGTYFFCMDYILRLMESGKLSYSIPFNNGSYRCDLAERFSQEETKCIFPAWQHHIEDLSQKNTSNTGMHHIFYNEKAPLRACILLIGDSHSYSALAPMLSNAVKKVRFIWASRRDNYGPFSLTIKDYAREADFVVEEVSERFFLRNFCDEVANEDTKSLLSHNDSAEESISASYTSKRQSHLESFTIDKGQQEAYTYARMEIERVYLLLQRTIGDIPIDMYELSEYNFRIQALQTVLAAVLSSTTWRGLNRRKFRKLIEEASRRVPNSGPAAAQHDVLLAESRRVLGLAD
uniref:hypothetical protein n=1 Tax=Methylobacterium sp. B34 TaxID=95563 RepID=UPI000FE14395|nr:hypothetical protein [Methylobacterium sp. B34]